MLLLVVLVCGIIRHGMGVMVLLIVVPPSCVWWSLSSGGEREGETICSIQCEPPGESEVRVG